MRSKHTHTITAHSRVHENTQLATLSVSVKRAVSRVVHVASYKHEKLSLYGHAWIPEDGSGCRAAT